MPVSAQLDGRKRAEDNVVRFLGQPVLQRHLLRAAQQVAADERTELLLPPLPLQVMQGRRLPPNYLISFPHAWQKITTKLSYFSPHKCVCKAQ